MKRLTLLFIVALFAALYPGNEVAFAQQGHGGGPGLSHSPSANSHGAPGFTLCHARQRFP
jgi:hypothetical protein